MGITPDLSSLLYIFKSSFSMLFALGSYSYIVPNENLYHCVLDNWDAPFIITTDVQFFQSAYHYDKKGLCKLHNMSNAVIVFDEIHTLPIKYLQPCLRVVKYLTRFAKSEALFLSATMPDYTELFQKYMIGVSVNHLITDTTLFDVFNTCNYVNLGKNYTYTKLVQDVKKHKQVLIIVNTKKASQTVYKMLSGNKYNLSNYKTPYDKKRVLKQVKADLKANKDVVLVATSLIEVGVDIDFEVVYREIAGLDNILQAGGRCNREGKLRDANGNLIKGTVYVFDSGNVLNSKDFKERVMVSRSMLRDGKDITSIECTQEYYRVIFKVNNSAVAHNNIVQFYSDAGESHESLPFRTYAEQFKLISEETIGVIIEETDDCEKMVLKLQAGDFSVVPKLQQYTVSITKSDFDICKEKGIIKEVVKGKGIYVLADKACYDESIGFCCENHNTEILIV